MARRKKKKKLNAVSIVKEMARERIGAPHPAQITPNRKKKIAHAEKHKPTLGELLREDD